MEKKWFETSCYRNLVDMHILDWNKKFLSELNPKKYVDMLTLAGVDSAMVYASSSVGICYWPTKVGHMHKALKGGDILGEIIGLCHQKEMNVIVYYSCMNKWAYDNHSDWQIINVEGEGAGSNSRYRVCCFNSPYRDFVLAQIEELCKNYKFEGIFFDMDFWPTVCYCSYCKKRYISEIGEKPPKIINWESPKWVKFQRKREEWLTEFASLLTSAVKKIKPDVTIEHQFASFGHDWQAGITEEFAKQSDYLGGDFYGNSLQQSFVCKFFSNLTENTPFEFMTSRCPNLLDHTTVKTKELLKAQIYSALANGGAFLFIDAIDPIGTLNKDIYEKMGEIFRETKGYRKYLGGKLCQDVGIYFSLKSNFDFADNGKEVKKVSSLLGLSGKQPHFEAALSVAKSLLNNHIPFGVITKKNLKELSSYQILVLPNLLIIDKEEVEAFTDFVASGGVLYASGYASLLTKGGERKEDFLLSDIFGISYVGETKEEVTYISPMKEVKDVFAPYSAKYPLTIFGSQIKVKARQGAKVLATVTLPYTDSKEINRFASLISNPPGVSTEYPSIILNVYRKGKALYSAANLELIGEEAHRQIFTNLIKLFSPKPFCFEADASKSVELILFHQEDKKRYLINLINFQTELPNIPVEGIRIRIRLDKKEPKRLIKLPEENKLTYEVKKDYAQFTVPKLETFLMLALDYR